MNKAGVLRLLGDVRNVIESTTPPRLCIGFLQRDQVGVREQEQLGDLIEILVGLLLADKDLVHRRGTTVAHIER